MEMEMEMEMESENGSTTIRLGTQEGSESIDFGRGLGFDRTVSRHHLSFQLHEDGTRVYFQVKGKNPIWVRHCGTHGIRLYNTSQSGQFNTGDSFCVSSKNPLWFHFKRIIAPCQQQQLQHQHQHQHQLDDYNDGNSDGQISYDEDFSQISGIHHDEIDTGHLSHIDPVKEFNFVVMGHEFDCYPKKLMREIKNWNWFLEEPDEDSDEEEDNGEKKSKRVARKKRKKGGRGDDDDDDVWTGESEENVELIKKSRNDPKPKYSTRSKDKNKKGAGASKRAKDDAKRKVASDDDDDDDDDGDDDETLGGFIVDDEDIGEGNEEDEKEEEFEEDEDDE